MGDSGLFTVPAQLTRHGPPETWVDVHLLVDTGASTLFLAEAFVRGLGFEPGPPRLPAGGLTGRRELETVKDVGRRIGGATPTRFYLAHVPVLPRESAMPEEVPGIAGFGVFKRMRATLSVDYDTNLASLEWP